MKTRSQIRQRIRQLMDNQAKAKDPFIREIIGLSIKQLGWVLE